VKAVLENLSKKLSQNHEELKELRSERMNIIEEA